MPKSTESAAINWTLMLTVLHSSLNISVLRFCTTDYNRSFETTKSAHSGHDVNPIPDYLIVGSDSGRIVVLEYDASNNVWKKLHQETFGKSGSRRIVPGQHLAVDPKGRSVMIGALEKSKL